MSRTGIKYNIMNYIRELLRREKHPSSNRDGYTYCSSNIVYSFCSNIVPFVFGAVKLSTEQIGKGNYCRSLLLGRFSRCMCPLFICLYSASKCIGLRDTFVIRFAILLITFTRYLSLFFSHIALLQFLLSLQAVKCTMFGRVIWRHVYRRKNTPCPLS